MEDRRCPRNGMRALPREPEARSVTLQEPQRESVKRARVGQPHITEPSFPNELLQLLPYVVTMLALAGFIGRAVPPRAVGVPYDPERT